MSRSRASWILAVVPAIVIVLAATTAFAGRPGGGGNRGGGFGGGMGGGGGSVMFLVSNPQVQTELELSDEQKESLTKLRQDSRGGGVDFQALQGLTGDERTKKLAELRDAGAARAAETSKKVNDILLPSQQERLRQIILQTQGPQAAATNDELAKALGLTDEQKQKLKDISAMSVQKLMEEKVLSVLTSDQKSKLESMKGKEFKLDPAQGFGGGNRQRGGGNNPPANDKSKSL